MANQFKQGDIVQIKRNLDAPAAVGIVIGIEEHEDGPDGLGGWTGYRVLTERGEILYPHFVLKLIDGGHA